MVDSVQIKDHDDQTQGSLDPPWQHQVGVGQYTAGVERDLEDRRRLGRSAEQDGKGSLAEPRDQQLERVEARPVVASASEGVMEPMAAPQQRHSAEDATLEIDGEIEGRIVVAQADCPSLSSLESWAVRRSHASASKSSL